LKIYRDENGELHTEDGPAIEFSNGVTQWYLKGKRLHTWKQYHKLSTLSPQQQMIVKLKYGGQLS
jgi:hypothetical protein